MYRVTLRHIHVTTVAMEKHKVLHVLGVCLYSCLSYPSWKVHVPFYIVICGHLALPYFSTISLNSMIFKKKATEHKKCDLIFSTVFV